MAAPFGADLSTLSEIISLDEVSMSEAAVALHNVTKIFTSLRGKVTEEVYAVREMNLEIAQGEFFTLLGPSGCGKTTTLRLLAGFEQPTRGEIFIQGKPMSKVPPNQRPVNTVFQNYALFPHLSVARNVAFGLEVRGVPAAEREQRVRSALEMVRLAEMRDRRPSQLSGGQQQRVALARALVNQPAVLLLDEPLGALDLKLRKAMQIELKQLQARLGITFVYVTHDQEEALTMSDRIAVMDKGKVLQVGDPVTLYEQPANRFVADFIGESNFLRGTVEAVEGCLVTMWVSGVKMHVQASRFIPPLGSEAVFVIRPEKMRMECSEAPLPGALRGEVQEVIYIGTDTRYLVQVEGQNPLVVRVQNGCGVPPQEYGKGDRVQLFWLPEDTHLLAD